MKKITIKDVAREAGVSVATVSNALNNLDVVLPKTREHVKAVAERLNYIPSVKGRRQQGAQKHAIGLFMSAIAGTYYSNIAEAIHYVLEERGYELQVYISGNADRLLEKLSNRSVDGAIAHCDVMGEEDVDRLKRLGLPVVFLDRETTGEKMSSVLYESYDHGRMAAEYLLGLGHRDLMHVAGPSGNYDGIQRQKGFLDALEKAGVPFRKENLIEGRFERLAAYREMRRYLQEGHKLPDGIFAANDHSAIGCLEALQEYDIHAPEDISVIGCDDNEMCGFFRPGLTTIRLDEREQATRAAKEALRLIHQNGGRLERLPASIIVRDTCRINRA